MFEFKPFSRKQRQILNWWTEDSPVKDYNGIIADGAIRSGKTLSMSLSFVMWSMTSFDGMQFGICGKTHASLRRNVLDPLKQALAGRGYLVEEHRGDNYWYIIRNGVKNQYHFFAGNDESSQDVVQGVTLAGIFFDEVALMPESFVNQATGRCSVTGRKFWFNCNPSTPYHWFKMNWIDDKEDKKMLYIHFELEDNKSLAQEIIDGYYKLYKGVFYQRYILGLWVSADGVIYDMFDTKKHVVEEATPVDDVYISCDYGIQNPTVFLMWSKIDGVWTCIKEYVYSGRDNLRQKTDSEFASDMTRWLDGVVPKYVIVDPSAASFIVELKRRGYRVKKGNNDVVDGIRFVSSMLSNNNLKICANCTTTIKEFQSYMWDSKAAMRGEDKPIKEHDHAMDALRYFCYTILGKGTPQIKTFKGGI